MNFYSELDIAINILEQKYNDMTSQKISITEFWKFFYPFLMRLNRSPYKKYFSLREIDYLQRMNNSLGSKIIEYERHQMIGKEIKTLEKEFFYISGNTLKILKEISFKNRE